MKSINFNVNKKSNKNKNENENKNKNEHNKKSLNNDFKELNNDFKELNNDLKESKNKIREKFENFKEKTSNFDSSYNELLRDYKYQINLINKLYLGEDFSEKKYLLSELKNKINSYKQQDIKKDLHDITNLITLDNAIEKLMSCKLKCYYCNNKLLLFVEKVRDENQWTLDRLNNFDEHTNNNTIIACLKCNLQRRRKNSDKFLFTKQLETNQLKIKKTEHTI